MKQKYNNIKRIILPNKRINIFVLSILFLGLIAGSIFMVIISNNDKTLVIEKIRGFIENIHDNKINSIILFKNSISINLLYIIIIWILGMALIGIIINFIGLFIKSFILGFSLSAFIITYSYKGILLSGLYLIFGQILNIIVLLVLTIYSITFSYNLLLILFKNSNINKKRMIKNYVIILLFMILGGIISSVSEAFIVPSLIKLIVKLYI